MPRRKYSTAYKTRRAHKKRAIKRRKARQEKHSEPRVLLEDWQIKVEPEDPPTEEEKQAWIQDAWERYNLEHGTQFKYLPFIGLVNGQET